MGEVRMPMILILVTGLVVVWAVVGLVVAGLCWAAGRGDTALEAATVAARRRRAATARGRRRVAA